MTSIAIIPIKSNSVRVPGKNFRPLRGKKLYEYIIDHSLGAQCFDQVCVDTDSQEIAEYCAKAGATSIPRDPWLSSNEANGNDLMVAHARKLPGYDLYFQLFATAPFLRPKTIKDCADFLASTQEYDSVFTATEEGGWFWCQGLPVNYRPGLLPRSQDAIHVIKETTGLYGITREAIERYHCRIGAKPHIYLVDSKEAVDLDTEQDFKIAELIA